MFIKSVLNIWLNQERIFMLTKKGDVKKVNEDSIYINIKNINGNKLYVGLVADGVSRGGNGKYASDLLKSFIHHSSYDYFKNNISKQFIINEYLDYLKDELRQVNTHLFSINQQSDLKAYAAFSLCVIYRDVLHIIHVGDTSVMILKDIWITLTTPQKIIGTSTLTNAIGLYSTLKYEYQDVFLSSTKLVALISDGTLQAIDFKDEAYCIHSIKKIKKIMKSQLQSTRLDDNVSCLLIDILRR